MNGAICGGGFYRVMKHRRWKTRPWLLLWTPASLYYGSNLVKRYNSRAAAIAEWRKQEPRMTAREFMKWMRAELREETP